MELSRSVQFSLACTRRKPDSSSMFSDRACSIEHRVYSLVSEGRSLSCDLRSKTHTLEANSFTLGFIAAQRAPSVRSGLFMLRLLTTCYGSRFHSRIAVLMRNWLIWGLFHWGSRISLVRFNRCDHLRVALTGPFAITVLTTQTPYWCDGNTVKSGRRSGLSETSVRAKRAWARREWTPHWAGNIRLTKQSGGRNLWSAARFAF